jgi:hypothetical protein
MFGKRIKKNTQQEKETTVSTKAYDSLMRSLEKVKDEVARQEQQYDKQNRDGEIVSKRIDELSEFYRDNFAGMNSFEEERHLLEIARLQEKLEHVVDMKNRIQGVISNFSLMQREIEASLQSESTLTVSQQLDPEALQNLISEIEVRLRIQNSQYTPVLTPAANPMAERFKDLRSSLLGGTELLKDKKTVARSITTDTDCHISREDLKANKAR